jgi:hypothetical protein
MNEAEPLVVSQVVVRVCLLLVAAIAMVGGALQMDGSSGGGDRTCARGRDWPPTGDRTHGVAPWVRSKRLRMSSTERALSTAADRNSDDSIDTSSA